MKHLFTTLVLLFLCAATYADKKKGETINDQWGQGSENRDISTPQFYYDSDFVYIYSEKQLDNLYIGITDMQGNVFHEETTTVPASQYYAIPISLLPNGTYYLSIIQGNNYVIGIFSK